MKINITINEQNDRDLIEKVLGEVMPDPCYTIGYTNPDGHFLVALTNYTRNIDIEGTCIAEGKWFDLGIYKHLFTWVFGTLKCKRFTFRIQKDNEKCIQLAMMAGCVKECELRGTDMLLFSIIPEECKYYVRRKT